MKRHVSLVVCLAASIMVVGCGDSPTKPTATSSTLGSTPQVAQSAQLASSTIHKKEMGPANFDPTQLGHASVTNGPDAATYTLIVWNANDEVNQREMAHYTTSAAPGETVDLTVGLVVDPCVRYQRDIYKNLPTSGHYTLSDVGNFFYAAAGAYWKESGSCDTVIPQCEVNCDPITPLCVVDCSPVVCTAHDTILFPPASYMAQFPTGFVGPWYPSQLGPFAFSIPAGTWHFTFITGDDHSAKPGEAPQVNEQATIEFYNGATLVATSGATLDVPEDTDTQVTDMMVNLPSAVTSIRIIHAGPVNPPEPTNSLYIVSLAFSCPDFSGQRNVESKRKKR